jgi:hypothetical protein
VKRGAKIALAVGVVALLGAGLFFANEANVFPRASRPMRSFTSAEKIWGAGDYVCAKVPDVRVGLRCALRGLGRDAVENAMTIEFLSNPTAMIEDAPHVCALERGEVLCWDMANPILAGLGLVYSPEQQRNGTIDHGTLPERAAARIPLQGTVRAMAQYYPGFCALADDGITCLKYKDSKDKLPAKLWSTKGKTLLVAGDLLCTEEGDALQCFADPSRYTTGGAKSDSPQFAMKVRAVGAKDVTAIAASYGGLCALSGGSVACAKRVNSGASPALEELQLTRVEGLKSPTQLWAPGLDIFVTDGSRIIQLDERAGFALKVWGTIAPGEEVYAGAAYDWFLYRSGKIVRSPNWPWPIKYDIGGKPSQVVSSGTDTCALVDGRVMCFGY